MRIWLPCEYRRAPPLPMELADRWLCWSGDGEAELRMLGEYDERILMRRVLLFSACVTQLTPPYQSALDATMSPFPDT